MQIETLVLKHEIKPAQVPTILITSEAYAKLIVLYNLEKAKIYEFMYIGEVEHVENIYKIKNIRLIPQTAVSSAHCETDDDKYPIWLQENYKINERKLIRFHGHSHVNMGTSPSGDDNNAIMKMMEYVNDYFIQFIRNLRGDYTLNLYDKENLLIYKNLEMKLITTTNVLVDISKSEILTSLTKNDIKDLKINPKALKIGENWKLNFDLSITHIDDFVEITNKQNIIINEKFLKKALVEAEKEAKELIPWPTSTLSYGSTYPNYRDIVYNDYGYARNYFKQTPNKCKNCQLKDTPYCEDYCMCDTCDMESEKTCSDCPYSPEQVFKKAEEPDQKNGSK